MGYDKSGFSYRLWNPATQALIIRHTVICDETCYYFQELAKYKNPDKIPQADNIHQLLTLPDDVDRAPPDEDRPTDTSATNVSTIPALPPI